MKTITILSVAAIIAFAVGCGKKGGAPPDAFGLTVDSVAIDGTVSDNLDTSPDVKADGAPVIVLMGAFTTTFDTTTVKTHTLTAEDNVLPTANKKTLTITVQ
jgi:hypothetical protein